MAETVELLQMDLQRFTLPIRGTSPLIVHAWSAKAKQIMRDKQTGRASKGREAKKPEEDYEGCFYRLPDGATQTPAGLYVFPAGAFKDACVRAGQYVGLKMTYLRGAFHVEGEFAEIEGEPRMREDMVRVGAGVADIRYRPEFPAWRTTLQVVCNARAISAEQIVNLLNVAGFSVGVGEWRPEKDGQYGRFEVEA
jgi:hypothetical protein